MYYIGLANRFLAYLCDYIVISFPLCIILMIVIGMSMPPDSGTGAGVIPFVIMFMVYAPYYVVFYSINNLDAFILLLFFAIPLLEVVFYCIEELIMKQTVGAKSVKMRLVRIDGAECPFYIRFFWHFFRAISKYLFFLPVITVLFSNKKQTLYDMLLKTVVVRSK